MSDFDSCQSNRTHTDSLHEVCVRTGVRYVITKFSGTDSLPNFLTHGAPLRARFARGSSADIFKCNFEIALTVDVLSEVNGSYR